MAAAADEDKKAFLEGEEGPVAEAAAAVAVAETPPARAEAKDAPLDEELDLELAAEPLDEMAFDVTPDAKALSSPAHRPVGLGLDLSRAIAHEEPQSEGKLSEHQLIELQSAMPVLVVFELPDGSEVENEFQMGQTVEVLKSFIAMECGMPMEQQQLFLVASDERPPSLLLDPMTLLDYPQIDPALAVVIRVDGEMEDGAKK